MHFYELEYVIRADKPLDELTHHHFNNGPFAMIINIQHIIKMSRPTWHYAQRSQTAIGQLSRLTLTTGEVYYLKVESFNNLHEYLTSSQLLTTRNRPIDVLYGVDWDSTI